VHRWGLSGPLQNTTNHVAAIEATHVIDDSADFARLGAEHLFGEYAEVQPRSYRQPEKPQGDSSSQKWAKSALLTPNPLVSFKHTDPLPLGESRSLVVPV
jgi:hypothetical protein